VRKPPEKKSKKVLKARRADTVIRSSRLHFYRPFRPLFLLVTQIAFANNPLSALRHLASHKPFEEVAFVNSRTFGPALIEPCEFAMIQTEQMQDRSMQIVEPIV
jgi:hypothetical protein